MKVLDEMEKAGFDKVLGKGDYMATWEFIESHLFGWK
jgi:hypothetical protein